MGRQNQPDPRVTATAPTPASRWQRLWARGRVLAALAAGALAASSCGSYGLVEVTPFGAAAYEPSVAAFRDGLAVAWYDTRSGHGELYEQSLDADGQFSGREVRLTTSSGDAFEADIQAVEGTASGGFVVGWYEKAPDGSYTALLGLWSRDGTPRWTKTLSPRGRNTMARVRGDLVFAAWIEDEAPPAAGVWAGWWNLRGEAVAAPRRIADAGKTTFNLNGALVEGAAGRDLPTALVVFDAAVGTKAEEIYLSQDDGQHAQVTRLTPDDGFASTYPDLALSGSRVALTWFDARDGNEEVYLRVAARPDLARLDARDTRVTSTKGHSIGAYTAWNGERLGVAWCDDSEGQFEIYFAEFDTAGTPRGPSQQLTETRAGSLIPSIHAWRTGFVLAWNEYEGAGPHDPEGRSQVLMRMIP